MLVQLGGCVNFGFFQVLIFPFSSSPENFNRVLLWISSTTHIFVRNFSCYTFFRNAFLRYTFLQYSPIECILIIFSLIYAFTHTFYQSTYILVHAAWLENSNTKFIMCKFWRIAEFWFVYHFGKCQSGKFAFRCKLNHTPYLIPRCGTCMSGLYPAFLCQAPHTSAWLFCTEWKGMIFAWSIDLCDQEPHVTNIERSEVEPVVTSACRDIVSGALRHTPCSPYWCLHSLFRNVHCLNRARIYFLFIQNLHLTPFNLREAQPSYCQLML